MAEGGLPPFGYGPESPEYALVFAFVYLHRALTETREARNLSDSPEAARSKLADAALSENFALLSENFALQALDAFMHRHGMDSSAAPEAMPLGAWDADETVEEAVERLIRESEEHPPEEDH